MKKFLISALLFLYAGMAFAAIDLNTATQADLEKIHGLGPKKAEAILQYRNQHGSFKNVSELKNVKGIGDGKTFQKLKGEFVVNTNANSTKPGPAMKAILPMRKASPSVAMTPQKNK